MPAPYVPCLRQASLTELCCWLAIAEAWQADSGATGYDMYLYYCAILGTTY